jgi:hypothetical protein
MVETKFQADVTERQPAKPTAGDEAWRLLEYKRDGYPLFEVYRAKYALDDGGDPENGPNPQLELGDWKQVVSGMGFPVLEQEIEHWWAAAELVDHLNKPKATDK